MLTLFDQEVADPARTQLDIEASLAAVEKVIQKIVNDRIAPSDREDVLQEIRLQVVRSLDSFDPSRGVRLVTWVGGIAKRICLRIRSDQYAEPPTMTLNDGLEFAIGADVESGGGDVQVEQVCDEDDPLFEELHQAVRAALFEKLFRKMTDRQREILSGLLVHDLNAGQIAVNMGWPLKDVLLVIRDYNKRAKQREERRREAETKPNLFSGV